jgi:hypothetical protein
VAAESDGPSDTQQLRALVDEAIVSAHRARTQYQRAKMRNAAGPAVEQQLRDAVATLHGVLHWWRDDDAVSDLWDDRNLDVVERWTSEYRSVTQEASGSPNRATETVDVLAIQTVGESQLLTALNSLLEVAKKLGFAPATSESVPRTEISEELFDEVDEWWEENVKDGEVEERWQAETE